MPDGTRQKLDRKRALHNQHVKMIGRSIGIAEGDVGAEEREVNFLPAGRRRAEFPNSS
jgi:hypothetical protein